MDSEKQEEKKNKDKEPTKRPPTTAAATATSSQQPEMNLEALKLPLEERKRMARNALMQGKLTNEDIAKLYALPLKTVIGMKGHMASTGVELTRAREPVTVRSPMEAPTPSDPLSRRISQLEEAVSRMRAEARE